MEESKLYSKDTEMQAPSADSPQIVSPAQMPSKFSASGTANEKPPPADTGSKTGFFASGWPNFRLKALEKYYPKSRWMLYTLAAIFTPVAKWKANQYAKEDRLLSEEVVQNAHKKYAADIAVIDNQIASIPPGKYSIKRRILSLERNAADSERSKAISDSRAYELEQKEHHLKRGKTWTSRLEVPLLLALTVWDFFQEKGRMKKNLAPSVAAELGLQESEVGLKHILRSNNPLIKSVASRFSIQNITRVISDLAFLIGVKTGIVAKAASITLERSAFLEDIAYDKLRNMVEEVQGDNLALNAKERLLDGFVNAIQRSRRDNRKDVLTRAEIDTITPILETMAQSVIERKMGISEVVYMLGIGLDISQPAESINNLNKILQIGLGGIAKEKRLGKPGQPVPAAPYTSPKEDRLGQNTDNKLLQGILAGGAKNPGSREFTGSPVLGR